MDLVALLPWKIAPVLATALLHSLWQCTLLALVAAIALSALSQRNAAIRHTVAMGILTAMVLVPVGLLPYMIGMSGPVALWIVLAANLMMVWQSVRLYREMEVKAARRVMFSSYIYLPVVLLALLADKNW